VAGEALMLYAIAFIIGLLWGIVIGAFAATPWPPKRKPQGRVIERLDPRRPW
jgi:hypothetical protein